MAITQILYIKDSTSWNRDDCNSVTDAAEDYMTSTIEDETISVIPFSTDNLMVMDTDILGSIDYIIFLPNIKDGYISRVLRKMYSHLTHGVTIILNQNEISDSDIVKYNITKLENYRENGFVYKYNRRTSKKLFVYHMNPIDSMLNGKESDAND